MPERSPIGIYARNTGDWMAKYRASGTATSGGSGGTVYWYAGLYNNATDGSVLYVLATDGVWGTANGNMHLLQGNPLLGVYTTVTQMIDPREPLIAGQLIGGYTDNPILTNVLWQPGGSYNNGYEWPHDYPLCILPPGYSLLLRSQDASNGVSMSLQWIALPE